jgi:cell division protein FtsQ
MRRGIRLLVLVSVTMVLALALPRVREALAGADFFRVVDVTVEGHRYLAPELIVSAAALSPETNLWEDHALAVARLRDHPGVREARILRRPPGHLILEIVEREPVALLPTPALTPVDVDGAFLPIDPAAHRLDLPLLHPRRDPGAGGPPLTATQIRALASELPQLAALDPDLLASVSDLGLDSWGDIVLRLESGVTVHYRPPLSPRRLQEGLLVLADVRERHPDRRASAIDLRFADQVVVRMAPGSGR